jgi:hypothetical protein
MFRSWFSYLAGYVITRTSRLAKRLEHVGVANVSHTRGCGGDNIRFVVGIHTFRSRELIENTAANRWRSCR